VKNMEVCTVLFGECMTDQSVHQILSKKKNRRGNSDVLLGTSPEARRRHTILRMVHAEFTANTSTLNLKIGTILVLWSQRYVLNDCLDGQLSILVHEMFWMT
jgi:hypothetical protein